MSRCANSILTVSSLFSFSAYLLQFTAHVYVNSNCVEECLSKSDLHLFMLLKQRDLSKSKDWILFEDSNKKKGDVNNASFLLQVWLPALHMKKPLKKHMRIQLNYKGSAMQMLIVSPVSILTGGQKNKFVIQLPVALHDKA